MSITSTVVHGATIRFHAATPALQPYVGCFWVVTAQRGATVRVVPDGTTSIAIEQQQNSDVGAYLRGPVLAPIELRFTAPTTLIGVRLRPGVAFNLTSVAVHTIVDRRVYLSEYEVLRGFAGSESVPQTPTSWITTMQDFLVDRLKGTSLHPCVETALSEIHAHQGRLSVPDIAARCGTSERHLGRLMRDWVGFGTKRYAGIVRFQSSLAQMERAPHLRVAMLAAETGYFDQSHLTLDVARYAGATPGHLLAEHVSDFSKTRCDIAF